MAVEGVHVVQTQRATVGSGQAGLVQKRVGLVHVVFGGLGVGIERPLRRTQQVMIPGLRDTGVAQFFDLTAIDGVCHRASHPFVLPQRLRVVEVEQRHARASSGENLGVDRVVHQ